MTSPKIPFIFLPPIPKFFKDKGFLKNPKNRVFLSWCFDRCSYETREIIHDNQQITLQPYQFIFGRRVCCEETGLTDNEVRHQQELWEKLFYLKKTTNKTPNRFTIYAWSTEVFLTINHQQNHHETTNKPPTEPPQTRTREHTDIKEQPEPRPVLVGGLFSCLDDFGLSVRDKEWIAQFSQSEIARAITIVNETKNPRSPIGLLKHCLSKKCTPKTNPKFELTVFGVKNREEILKFKARFENDFKIKDIEIKDLGDQIKIGPSHVNYEDNNFCNKIGQALQHVNLLHLVKPEKTKPIAQVIQEQKVIMLKNAANLATEILQNVEEN